MASNTETRFKKGMVPWNKGRGLIKRNCIVCNEEFIYYQWENKSGKYCSLLCYHSKNSGENHFRWSADPAYTTIHNWVHRHFGFPNECEKCHKIDSSNRKIHWSNISGKYVRSRTDWQRLCASCHKKYDLNRIKSKTI